MSKQNVRYVLESIESLEKEIIETNKRGDTVQADSLYADLLALNHCLVIEIEKLLKEAA